MGLLQEIIDGPAEGQRIWDEALDGMAVTIRKDVPAMESIKDTELRLCVVKLIDLGLIQVTASNDGTVTFHSTPAARAALGYMQ